MSAELTYVVTLPNGEMKDVLADCADVNGSVLELSRDGKIVAMFIHWICVITQEAGDA